jgi:hypothetical protein
MEVKAGVTLAGLHLLMRPALGAAEKIWKAHGIAAGVMITEARGGVHSARSLHPYGLALDMRTRYFTEEQKIQVYSDLQAALPLYDIILHNTHIHVEPSNSLLDRHGLLI